MKPVNNENTTGMVKSRLVSVLLLFRKVDAVKDMQYITLNVYRIKKLDLRTDGSNRPQKRF